ncbi:WD40 repeat protein [Paenibacillus taihuensis]|uniref:WD40 repeat protein n=1 Tax=Paenibacillus taihuensis TaxID=1156355 RepID=A0A3D9RI80_9BACL|nr:PD40 domain-containing protein [Paenibacillus taihuensis]REE77736.1 WD40 repeat protein [Paenibacillus taihuensis]
MGLNREEVLSRLIDHLENGSDKREEFEMNPELEAMIETVRKLRGAARIYQEPSNEFAYKGWEQITYATKGNKVKARLFLLKRFSWITAAAALLLVIGLIFTPILGRSDVNASELSVSSQGQLLSLGVKQAMSPRYAGSDQNISYGVEDEIFLWDRTSGQSMKLSLSFPYMRDAAWSPDGKMIAFSGYNQALRRTSVPGIWVVNRNGSGSRLVALPSNADTAFEAPVWSPDGKRIAFTAVRARLSDETGVMYERTIHIVNTDGTELGVSTKGSQPTWSPDGKKISYTLDEGSVSPQIWIMNLSDHTQRKLVDGQMPAWSPAGPFVAYVKTRVEHQVLNKKQERAAYSAEFQYQELWAINIESGTETQLTHSAYPVRLMKELLTEADSREDLHAAFAVSGETSDGHPAWSPNGKNLVFTRNVNEESGIHFSLQELTIDYH